MRNYIWPRGRRVTTTLVVAVAVLGGLSACRADELLEANDPDLIFPEDLDNLQGAEGLRLGALSRLRTLAGGSGSGGENVWLYSGLLVDEFGSSSTFTQNDETDKRVVLVNNSLVTSHFRDYHRARVAALMALEALRKHKAADVVAAAEMFFVKGFAELSLAQDFCNGVPLSVGKGADDLTYGGPLDVVQVFDTARASFDSALNLLPASVTGTEATRIRNAARVGKARALIGISRANLAEAATVVAAVPTDFAYNSTFVVGSGDNQIWLYTTSNRRYTIGDSVEGNARNIRVFNAIPFLSAGDPRVPARYVTTNVRNSAGQIIRVDTSRGQDGQTYARVQSRYARSDPLAVVNGIDARLIEAESQMEAGNFATATTGTLAILNRLRTGPTRVGGSDQTPLNVSNMTALTDPGTPEARLSLFFREKAFWTFGRGQRLNDLRRQVRQYGAAFGRTPETTFPVGEFFKGGQYGPDMNFPIPQAELNNPEAETCTNRDA